MRALVLTSALVLSACSTVPSFYDDNESLLAVDVRMAVNELNCTGQSVADETAYLKWSIDRLAMYSESKKSTDVYPLVIKMKETTNGIETSPTICSLKKKVLDKQSADIANAVMRRF